MCGLSHKSKQFKQLDTSFSMQLSGTPPQLVISKLTGPPNLDVIETAGKLVIELLQTSLESRGLSGKIFVNSLHCLASIVLKDVGLKCDQISSSHSSELLECEQVMPKSQSEYLLDSQKLYITAALCENLSGVILKDLDVSHLLDDFRVIFECHAKLGDEVQLLPGKNVGGEITGGPVSLSICCGVLSALLGGNKTVKYIIFILLTHYNILTRVGVKYMNICILYLNTFLEYNIYISIFRVKKVKYLYLKKKII